MDALSWSVLCFLVSWALARWLSWASARPKGRAFRPLSEPPLESRWEHYPVSFPDHLRPRNDSDRFRRD